MGARLRARTGMAAITGTVIALILAMMPTVSSAADEPAPAPATGTITGHVEMDGGAPFTSSPGWTWVSAIPVGGGADPYTAAVSYTSTHNLGADGDYIIENVPAGEYTVQTRWGCDCFPEISPHFDEFYGGATDVSGAAPVTVAAGAATSGIDFSLEPAAMITGALSPASADVTVYRQVGTTWQPVAGEVEMHDTYVIGNLHAGTYAVGAAKSGYCPLAPDAPAPADRPRPVAVAPGANTTADVVLAKDTRGCGPVLASATPTIAGTAAVGAVLTAKPGTWTAGTAFTYQWLANGKAVSGATRSTFALAAAQLGTKISVQVAGTATRRTGVEKTSAVTAAVKAGTLKTATPTIAGAVALGSKLTAKPGTWTAGASFAYQWYADGKAVAKATASTYTVASALLGKRISVRVTGAKAGYTTVAKTSAATAKAARAGAPTVSGAAAVGTKLTAKPGTWTTGTSLAYQWRADGKAIAKATKSTFTVGGAQVGRSITVTVTGRKSGYATVAKTSKGTARVPKTATPAITGTRAVTGTVTAKPGAWTSGTAFTYQWYASGKAIAGATKSTLKLGTAQAGKKITVRVTGRKSGYTSVAKTSAATAAIGYPARTAPSSLWNCPAWAPIKGNANSGIYHMPGQRFYTRTQPEDCYRTEAAAKADGYRKAKV